MRIFRGGGRVLGRRRPEGETEGGYETEDDYKEEEGCAKEELEAMVFGPDQFDRVAMRLYW